MLEVHQGFKGLLINGVGLVPDGQIRGLRHLRRCVNIDTEFGKPVKPGERWRDSDDTTKELQKAQVFNNTMNANSCEQNISHVRCRVQ
jgi:hypothetical protein